jgi:hypothetical protein
LRERGIWWILLGKRKQGKKSLWGRLNARYQENGVKNKRLGLMIHVYNPSYLGSRDRKDCGLRPAWAKI